MISDALNLIIDFNNIAMRAMFTCIYNGSNVGNFDTDDECGILARKISTDITFILKMFMPKNVIIVADSKDPWRERIYDGIENLEYKGTRMKDETKNWKNIYKTFDSLNSSFSKNGLNVIKIDNAEADDIAAMCVNHFRNVKKENTILISSDRDWHQLIYFSESDGSFCSAYNPTISNKKSTVLYGTDDFFKWLDAEDDIDIFFTGFNPLKKKMCEMKALTQKVTFETIVPYNVLLEKIICGDAGDNVPSFYEYYNNGKKYRITPLKLQHIRENINIDSIDLLTEACSNDTMMDALKKELKRDIDDIDAKERLTRQRMLVELNESLFPKNIVESFKTKILNINEFCPIDYSNLKLTDIIKGNQFYEDEKSTRSRDSAVFNTIKDLEKYIKPIF